MRKIVTVVGARPQFIKAAIVSRALRSHGGFTEKLIHTGQHYDSVMSDIFFEELGIGPPAYNLGVGSGSHGYQTGRMLEQVEEILMKEKPDLTLVYGDTNSTLAGALAAVKLHIPAVHIEAGLRSYNRYMPEEINRLASQQMCSLLFAATRTAEKNLLREGFPPDRIRLVGDVMYDAALVFAARARQRSRILEQHGLSPRNYILATVHRAENTDNLSRLRAIFDGLCELSSELRVVLPLHPRTRNILNREGLFDEVSKRVQFLDAVGYLDMIQLERNAAVIATDSGGVQKEAFFCQVPCVILRDETEWTELIDTGAGHLVGADARRLVDTVAASVRRTTELPDPGPYYGNGEASARIASILATAELEL